MSGFFLFFKLGLKSAPGQYSRRPVPRGNVVATLEKETGISEDMILTNLDKAHPIGRVEDGKQLRIVKSRSDHFKEVIYKNHKL